MLPNDYFTDTILLTFFLSDKGFYKYLVSNISTFLLNVSSRNGLWLKVASAFCDKSWNLFSIVVERRCCFLAYTFYFFLLDVLNFVNDNEIEDGDWLETNVTFNLLFIIIWLLAINYFRKTLNLRCLTGFWIRLCWCFCIEAMI